MAAKKTVNKTETKVDVTKAKASVKQAVKDVKEVAEVVADKVVDEVKETAGVVAKETKEVVAKAKKATAKKEVKTTLYVQYFGKEVSEKEMIASVKKAWTQSGHKVGEIKTITLYVKPEEAAVYYVINGTETGKVEF